MDESAILKIVERIIECDNEIRDKLRTLDEELKDSGYLHNHIVRLAEKTEALAAESGRDLEIIDSIQAHVQECLENIKEFSLWLEELGSRVDEYALSEILLEDAYKQNQQTIARLTQKAKKIQEFLASQKQDTTENLEKDE